MYQPSSQSGGNDQTMSIFWLVGGIVGAGIVLWFMAKKFVVATFFGLRTYEIDAIIDLVNITNPLLAWLHLPELNLSHLEFWKTFMATTPLRDVTWQDIISISDGVGQWERVPVLTILGSLAALLLWHSNKGRFRTIYSMKNLRKLENSNWPQITPIVDLDLVKEDIDKGPWAMAQQPLGFCRQHNLVYPEKGEKTSIWRLHKGPAYKIFVLQLGPKWRGANHLPIHLKALVVIFMARALREADVAKKFLYQIAASASHGQLNFSGVEEQLKKYANHKLLKWVEGRHAYVTTVLATLLQIARAEGVLSTAEFLWLKPVDRRMWYMLNSVGRQTAVVEIAGAFSHWLAERKIKRRLKVPMVKEAVLALDDAVKNILYVDEGDVWHSNAA